MEALRIQMGKDLGYSFCVCLSVPAPLPPPHTWITKIKTEWGEME